MAKKRKRRKKHQLKLVIPPETSHSVLAIFLMAFGVLILVSFSGQGLLLQKMNNLLTQKLGLAMLFLPFVFISAGLATLRAKWVWSKPHVLLGTLLMMFSTLGLGRTGEIGRALYTNFANLLTAIGSIVLFFSFGVIGFLVMTQWSVAEITKFFSKKKNKKEADKETKDLFSDKKKGFSLEQLKIPGMGKSIKKGFAVNEGKKIESETELLSDQAKTKEKISSEKKPVEGKNLLRPTDAMPSNTPVLWEYPPLSLLSDKPGGKAQRGDVKANAQIIENTLDSFGIKARVAEVNFGPAVTQYALEISKGTRLSKITSLSTDLALALAAPTGQIRVEAPIAGRSLVGIEVPNHSAEFVTLKGMLSSPALKKHPSKLAVSLGIDVSGKAVAADISRMPHVLIAGATGSGKSVAINAFMSSILFRASPSEVKFILVDPKRVELTAYNDIPHLLTPVIVEPSKVVSALKWAVKLMEDRYKQLAEVGVKNIDSYNELAGLVAMPNIVIVIDELADVMLFAPNEVEESITRIAQMARAVGIHLVLATQRPSVDVITGLIKANIPTRIAFNVSSQTDSRVILDSSGAEKLLGRGDMLYISPDKAKPSRVQGTFISEQETRNLTNFLKSQGQKPDYQEDITSKYKPGIVKGGSGGAAGENRDALFNDAAKLFSQYDKASASLIQRRLSVGYARAARILDQLFEAGFVGAPDGSKPREVHQQRLQEYLGSTQSMGD
ncbi:MAG: DNA translocase FtsK [Candidatus Pacebacteria bacterium]|jgi:DNA segregation ATPase FtsK/SpoIIIE, S-DNA-T family|nr:DNA translocase FtsK [Candidatus Paceibacterota bacterium]MBT4652417.1 DNA translocase FtsK [Candidatus Paceibacterota bacterium]MBT6756244.1 DNA translocase FtsK [Candidatus Paceibacterota bacterium]MBT6921535.1 DNA translocase FtsK [Candidatus Paceibacterota bacterium]